MHPKFVFLKLLIIFFSIQTLASTNKPISIKACTNRTITTINLGAEFQKKAQNDYQDLDSSPFFNRDILKNLSQLRREFEKEVCSHFIIHTTDNAEIRCTFFNRNSGKLVVIGPGFPTPRQRMVPFIHIFSHYDVVLFDYRGQGLEYSYRNSSWLGSLTYHLFGIDMGITGLGTVESADVKAVVHAMRNKKNYEQIYGLGLCYSSFIFAQAAAEEPTLFDKLILDGSWPSLKNVIKKIAKNPSLIFAKQPPSSPLPWITHKPSFQNYACTLTEWLTSVDLNQVPLLAVSLAELTMPILFFQCLNDCYCSQEEFATLWDAPRDNKIAVFTENMHGRNHLWQKELYACICNRFLDHDPEAFVLELIQQSS